MRIFLTCFSIVIWWSSCLFGYHHQFLVLQTAEQLYPRQAVIGISHRFLGEILSDNGTLGQNLGANVGFFAKFGLPKQQVINMCSFSLYSQTGLSYKKSFHYKNSQWYGAVLHLDQLTLNSTQHQTASLTMFYALVNESLDVVINTIYKDYFPSVQVGFGVAWQVIPKVKLFYEGLSFANQYASYPNHIFGSKIMTFGHNFYLFIANENNVGFIPASSGSSSNNIYCGFKIERIFDF